MSLFLRSRSHLVFIGVALKSAPIMEWEFILVSGRSGF
jgi:hypothetical protein